MGKELFLIVRKDLFARPTDSQKQRIREEK